MKSIFSTIFYLSFAVFIFSQDGLPQDYLSSEFHKNRREALRDKMPKNSVAVFFANPVRNRANDVEYVYHQDPNFYYLTGYKEPHSVLVIFSEIQTNAEGKTYNEILYVQQRNARWEMWTGRRLGTEGAKNELGFKTAYNGKEFLNSGIDFTTYDAVLFKDFKDDYRDSKRNKADMHDLVASFKTQIGYYLEETVDETNDKLRIEMNQDSNIATKKAKIDTKLLTTFMAGLRQIKTPEEMKLLTKAIRISSQGQIEVMKAMHPGMSETELQGIHEFVYKKYGSEYEGYPSIVGAGNNGCVLHYVENNKMQIEGELVLMDLGAEYHGYTADVTRTIPANGKFTPEQKAIYDIVYQAQEAGIAAAIIGNNGSSTHSAAKKVINEGLAELGIIKSVDERHMYFPHGTSHHIGLDVHDLNLRGNYEANMVITVEPGIYIPEGSDCDKKWWGIAVRIEDDILITENGPVNLSAEAPRKSEEIEALMTQKSALDDFKLPKLD
ncbi:MAG: aminopeptidase P family protein [Bacteroidetes bacterium]|nr:MAG: aminopeptidase P family protein [Bacteroidota bacterium]